MTGSLQPKIQQKFNLPLSTALFLIFVGIIAYLWYSGLPLVYSVSLALISLIVGGELLIRSNGFARLTYGIYMARSKLGLKAMDRLASKNRWFWNGLADWGMVLGFGFLSVLIFKRDISKKTIALGVFSVLFILTFVLPYAILPFAFINIPQITARLQGVTPSTQFSSLSLLAISLYAVSVLGGFVLYTIASLAYGAWLALYGIFLAAITTLTSVPNYTGLSNSIPGVAPIIPGITIPLVPGLLAFALLLVVHEFSHGILARIAKVKIKSSGFLAIGVVPIGAFVEPDEKAINKLSNKLQNRISAAGISANMLLCLIMFVPTVLMFYYVMPHTPMNYTYIAYVVPNSPAYNAHVVPGSALLRWNGYVVNNIPALEQAAKKDTPYSNVTIVTNVSTYSMVANRTGKVGVGIDEATKLAGPNPGPVASFVYTFVSLSFLLNFLIAIVNLLPIPSFDGWRFFNTSIKSKKVVRYIAVFVILLFILNALPWLWNF